MYVSDIKKQPKQDSDRNLAITDIAPHSSRKRNGTLGNRPSWDMQLTHLGNRAVENEILDTMLLCTAESSGMQ